MAVDAYYEMAQELKIVDVWKAGNETGWVTPRILYDPAYGKAPALGTVIAWFDHGTVGSNTLQFWGTQGSIRNGTYSLAQFLVPHNSTRYADGKPHDTRNVVFKMVPDGRACNHTGKTIAPYGNWNSLGVEYESLQNGNHDFDVEQYIKGNLIYCHAAAVNRIGDHMRVSHGTVALPWGRRRDPWAGKFDYGYSWSITQEIRRDSRIWELWGLAQPIHR